MQSADPTLEKLQELQELQYKVLSYRTDKNLAQVMKETFKNDLTNLLKVEMDLVQTDLKMPKPSEIPPRPKQISSGMDIDKMLHDAENTKQAMQLLK